MRIFLPFQDVPADGWYYRDVMEATVPHTNDAVEGDERWKDYLHTYRLTFRDGNSQSVQLVQEGKTLERVPATGGTHWLTANGAVTDSASRPVSPPHIRRCIPANW